MILPCPCCTAEIEVSEEDPDASLDELHRHLHEHTRDPDAHMRLFIRAQQDAFDPDDYRENPVHPWSSYGRGESW